MIHKKHLVVIGLFIILIICVIQKMKSNVEGFSFKRTRPKRDRKLESLIKINLLKKDNIRLREILSLQQLSNNDYITAAVISRKTGGWWRQIILNKGSRDGVEIGNIVTGPGGLLGRVNNTSLFTSSVTLLTSPESKLGVWVDRSQTNGVLVGSGDDHPRLLLYSKDADIKVGDFVSSSPACSLLPPYIPIGIVQSIDKTSQSKKTAKILLLAKPNVIDWVQILRANT